MPTRSSAERPVAPGAGIGTLAPPSTAVTAAVAMTTVPTTATVAPSSSAAPSSSEAATPSATGRASAIATEATTGAVATTVRRCRRCDSELAASLRACPSCGQLVHTETLKALAADADAAAAAGDLARALTLFRDALALLPPDSRQHQLITAKTVELGRRIDALPRGERSRAVVARGPANSVVAKTLGTGAALSLVLWKLKTVLAFLLTQGKLVAVGFTSLGTLLSIVASLAVFWRAWGWKLAAGVLVTTYLHEIGHVAALRRYGIKATAPMFIPGIGAFVRGRQYPANRREDARVGLAGPLWGAAAAVVALAIGRLAALPSLTALAYLTAWMNILNLLPVWQLDGNRGFSALTRPQRWVVVFVTGGAWFASAEAVLLLLFAITALAAIFGRSAADRDDGALTQLVGLVAVLAAVVALGHTA